MVLPVLVAATLIAAVAWAAIWLFIVPRDVVCPGAYTMTCTDDGRTAHAAVWSLVVAAVYAGTVAVSLTVGRRRPWTWLTSLVTLAAVTVAGCLAMLSATARVVG